MRVLVTGHLGYIGTVLTPMLLSRGHQVIGFDSDLYEQCLFGPRDSIADIPEIRKDVRDATVADVTGFDAVLHLAGLSNDPLGDLNPDLTFEINYQASVRLAELCRSAGVRYPHHRARQIRPVGQEVRAARGAGAVPEQCHRYCLQPGR